MAIVMVALDRCLLDRAVHSLDLAVDPGMFDLGRPVLDVVLVANAVEDVFGQHGVDDIRYCGDDRVSDSIVACRA